MNREIIGLTGLTCVGKGEVAKLLREEYHAEEINISAIVSQVVEERYGTTDRELVEQTFVELGDDFISGNILARVNDTQKELIVIDSIRRIPIYEAIRDAYPTNFHFVGVHAPRSERLRRIQARNRPGDPRTDEALRELDREQLGGLGTTGRYETLACLGEIDVLIKNKASHLASLPAIVSDLLQSVGISNS